MHLPVLKSPPEGTVLDKSTCQGKDNCVTCQLYVNNGGRCEGCSPQKKAKLTENFQWCHKECHSCTGYEVKVTAICCRSPLKDMYMTAVTKGAADWNKPKYDYKERAKLKFKQRAVFYISSGGVNTIASGGAQLIGDDHEVAAVNISRVWGSNGFYSKDMKDYLHMSPKTKLILLSMSKDDLLERAWTKEMYADVENLQRVGFDFWHPLSFSAYPNEARMHQYYQYLRTLYATEKSEAHFVSGDHYQVGLHLDDLYLESVKKVPQVVINTQFVVDDETWKWHLGLLKHYHEITPPNVAFWLVGATTPTFLHNARKYCGHRDLYFMSAKPLYLASKGQQLTLGGKSLKSTLPKLELVQENYRQFAQMVKQYS
jgi:hypothetical protein